MDNQASDTRFAGSIPALYDRLLVPLIFEPYAADMAARAAALDPAQVLEIAAGTGAVTRAMARMLPERASIVATDLNPAMLDHAAAVGTARPVTWRQADAMRLPFEDARFDVVVCQFGAMFFPDKALAFAEARRVLRPEGMLLFNVWDPIEDNELADTVTTALAALYPGDPPRFMVRTPHGHSDRGALARELAKAGFDAAPRFETLTARSRAASAREAAVAYCQGTPLRNEIEARAAAGTGPGLDAATEASAAAIAARFGAGALDAKIQALIVSVRR